MFVHSQHEAKDIVAGRPPSLFAVGNTTADHLAGVGATLCRVPECFRARVAQIEHQAYVVRMRILS
eukprot:9500318-Pyramimonas_sp.AAC.1